MRGGIVGRRVGPGRGGAALAIVLWALVALAALAAIASLGARLDVALTYAHRDHGAALALAEAGIADALAALAADPARRSRPDSVLGALETGTYVARWEPTGGAIVVVAEGSGGTARRAVEARVSPGPTGGLRIATWRELR